MIWWIASSPLWLAGIFTACIAVTAAVRGPSKFARSNDPKEAFHIVLGSLVFFVITSLLWMAAAKVAGI